MSTFALGNVMSIHFLDRPARILLGKYKYQHKFLYVLRGSGQVKLDHSLFNFSQGSFYAFRIANGVELTASVPVTAFVIVFNTIPFPDNRLPQDLKSQLRIVDRVNSLVPITSEIHEYRVQHVEDQESVGSLVKMIRREIAVPQEHSEEIILNNALNILNIAVRIAPEGVSQKLVADQSSCIAKVTRFVQDKVKHNKKVTVAEIARELKTTEYVLNRTFIKDSGTTFAAFLRKTKSQL